MSSYTTQAQVQYRLAEPIATEDSATVAALITEASAIVDGETGRSWPSSPSSAARRFVCDGTDYLRIDEALEVTAVTETDIDGDVTTLVVTDDYILEPGGAGNTPTAPYAHAITGIRRVCANWLDGPAYATVTGKWASANAVPTEIAIATALIVAAWCEYLCIGTTRDPNVQQESWDGYSRQLQNSLTETPLKRELIPANAMQILARYRQGGPVGTFVLGV